MKVDPRIHGRAPCRIDTRVPMENPIHYLEGGDSFGEHLEDFASTPGPNDPR